MKKLLVAAMGIAAAYGAFADPFSVGKRFEGLTVDEAVTTNELNEAAGGIYWTDPVSATNTYTVKEMGAYTGSVPALFEHDDATNALEVKTTFGQPLKFNFMGDGGTTKREIGDGLYFDSLVKFTVCDGVPEDKEAYNGAKIMMWLQSDDDTVTNVMIRAGYLTYNVGQVSSVATNYTCYTRGGDFADKWHRVTIKAISDITSDSSTVVPGFVVFLDGAVVNVSGKYEAWDSNLPARTAKADYWVSAKALFPSMVQSGEKTSLSAVEFDGTGYLNDVTVTDTAPDFAEDQIAEAPEVSVEINGAVRLGVTTFADAVAAVNGESYEAEGSAKITLAKGVVITEPLEFTADAEITLDFAGFVLTNELAVAAITNSATTLIITDSSETVGGIWCNDAANDFAFYAAGGATTIEAGFFHGLVGAAPSSNLGIVQGYFTQVTGQLEAYLPDDKELAAAEEMPGFNKVVDKQVETHTITFNANGGVLTDAETQVINDGDAVEKPSDPTRTDYKFVGWFWDDDGDPETPMVEFDFSDAQDPVLPEDDITLYAQWEGGEPAEPEIDPSNPEPVEVEAEDGDTAIEEVKVNPPAGAGISGEEALAAYKDLFNFTATETSQGSGVYEVTLTGIKEEKVADVNEDAVESLVAAAQDEEADSVSIDVPAGLYYKITTYDALGDDAVDFETGLSNGSGTTPVDKPASTTQGFIKVELSTVPFN